MFRYLPQQASELAPDVDWIHNLITDISVFFTVVIVGAMLYFAIRYRRRDGRDHETPQIRGNDFLEMVWTIVPAAISVFVLYWGIVVFKEMKVIPKNALEIQVRGEKWRWDFEYKEGKKTTGEFVVPVDTPIKLVMRSRDVIHSFFIPEMRVKKDVLPNLFTYIAFTPVKTGSFTAYCTEFCGDMHSAMLATLKVVPKAEFERWLNDRSDEILASRMSLTDLGAQLYKKHGCFACHTLDGQASAGPTFLKLYGRTGKLNDGKEYIADENYIEKSILDPAAQVVENFQPVMPAFAGKIEQKDMDALIAFIKSLDKAPVAAAPAQPAQTENLSKLPPEERGKSLFNNKGCVGCHSLDGTPLMGPTFKGLYGKKGKLVDGSAYEATDEYIKSSILNSTAQIVEGFQPLMPPMQLSDSEIKDLIEFIKTVK